MSNLIGDSFNKITRLNTAVLLSYRKFMKQNGYAPRLSELSKAAGYSEYLTQSAVEDMRLELSEY